MKIVYGHLEGIKLFKWKLKIMIGNKSTSQQVNHPNYTVKPLDIAYIQSFVIGGGAST